MADKKLYYDKIYGLEIEQPKAIKPPVKKWINPLKTGIATIFLL